jgi:hypothetical protein
MVTEASPFWPPRILALNDLSSAVRTEQVGEGLLLVLLVKPVVIMKDAALQVSSVLTQRLPSCYHFWSVISPRCHTGRCGQESHGLETGSVCSLLRGLAVAWSSFPLGSPSVPSCPTQQPRSKANICWADESSGWKVFHRCEIASDVLAFLER